MEPKKTLTDAGVRRGVIRWAVRETMGCVIYALMLFWPAGTVNWPMGWVVIVAMVLWVAGTAAVTIPRYPELLAERVGPRKGGKSWDTAILGIFGVMMVAKLLLAGFDFRLGWTKEFPLWLEILGLIVALPGYAVVVWATGSNAYFSQIVRIQTERGHRVADGGPYRFVRHPSYVGIIASELGTAAMLGSGWALVPAAISAVLMILRTALEDRTLQAELDGYADFAKRTRYRLIPGVW